MSLTNVQIGQRIRDCRKHRNKTLQDVADAIGVQNSTISRYEKGQIRKIKLPVIEAIASYLGVNPEYLLGKDDDPIDYDDAELLAEISPSLLEHFEGDAKKALAFQKAADADAARERWSTVSRSVLIPVLGDVQAGIPIEAIEDILDYEEITPEMAATGDHFGLRIRGQSMEPRFVEGDVIIVRKQPDVDTGDIAVVLVNGNSATVKKIKKSDAGITLIPLNPAFDPMFYSNQEIIELPVCIIGKIVELRGKY